MELGAASTEALGIQVLKGLTANQLAEHYAATNRLDHAVAVVETALADLADNPDGEHWYASEQYRMLGDLVLGGDSARAEASYQTALSIARRQSAKSLELRAAIRLAKLWRTWGRPGEAHDLLEPILAWFSEGFETRDHREARAMLRQTTPA
jgi:predicted ATPase